MYGSNEISDDVLLIFDIFDENDSGVIEKFEMTFFIKDLFKRSDTVDLLSPFRKRESSPQMPNESRHEVNSTLQVAPVDYVA